jgi:hypothetical protein
MYYGPAPAAASSDVTPAAHSPSSELQNAYLILIGSASSNFQPNPRSDR